MIRNLSNGPYCYLLPYGLFLIAMGVLTILPDGFWRLCYIYGVSTLIFTFNSVHDNTFLGLAVIHGMIHHLWPFMTSTGYNQLWSPFYDVVWHLVMLYKCYSQICKFFKDYPNKKFGKPQYENIFYYVTYISIAGSLLNCFLAPYSMTPESWEFTLFGLTAIFQAISTGFWVSTCLWFNHWDHPDFFRHWGVWLLVTMGNWALYQVSDDLIGLSMEFRYVEALFIVASWMAFLPKPSTV